MKFLTGFRVAFFLTTTAHAQQDYTVDPDTVAYDIRTSWCLNQRTQCPLICLQTPAHSGETTANACDPDTLSYSCVCSNGLSPNISEYSQTIPYYVCSEWGNQCVESCGYDSSCAAACRTDHPCGAQNPTRYNVSTTSRNQMTSSAIPTGEFANPALGSSSRIGSSVLDLGIWYGPMIALTVVFGACVLVL